MGPERPRLTAAAEGRKSEHGDSGSHVAPSCTRSPGATQPGLLREGQEQTPTGLLSLRPRPGASSLSVPPGTWALPCVLPQGGSQEQALTPGARTCGHSELRNKRVWGSQSGWGTGVGLGHQERPPVASGYVHGGPLLPQERSRTQGHEA